MAGTRLLPMSACYQCRPATNIGRAGECCLTGRESLVADDSNIAFGRDASRFSQHPLNRIRPRCGDGFCSGVASKSSRFANLTIRCDAPARNYS
jgi:hypothetical protein